MSIFDFAKEGTQERTCYLSSPHMRRKEILALEQSEVYYFRIKAIRIYSHDIFNNAKLNIFSTMKNILRYLFSNFAIVLQIGTTRYFICLQTILGSR